MRKDPRTYTDRPRDSKRTNRAKSQTLARKQQRRAKFVANGRAS